MEKGAEYMKHQHPEADFDPSLHIIPLDPHSKTPVILGALDATLVAVTADGRISFFPVEGQTVFFGLQRAQTIPLITAIQDRIKQRFPKNKDIYGNKVSQYLAVGVMYGQPGSYAKFIFEIWGVCKPFKELEHLYSTLHSLGGTTVGDDHYTAVQKYLSSEPVSRWINELIRFLKEQLDWSNYVRQSLELQ